MSKYEAVVFDLWGTLVDDLVNPEANRLRSWQKRDEVADLLGVARDEFAREWDRRLDDWMAGVFSSTESGLLSISRTLGVEPDDRRIRSGAQVWHTYILGALSPRPGTVETLSILRDRGYRAGLISNCAEEVSRLWNSTAFADSFDSVVLSNEVCLTKPDPRIYETVIERLATSAGRCLYVGDGSGCELSGAARVGMTAVLMRAPMIWRTVIAKAGTAREYRTFGRYLTCCRCGAVNHASGCCLPTDNRHF